MTKNKSIVDLYLDSGYLNHKAVRDLGLPFNFLVGGRGTGKTYSGLLDMYDNKFPFFFLRRLQIQADLVGSPEFSPFGPINEDRGTNIQLFPVKKVKNVNAIYDTTEDDKGKLIPFGDCLGYVAALATFSNLRGFGASYIKYILLDEFIPEANERPIKDEGRAFLNMYETVNRNRELKGLPPVQVFCYANANDLGNPIFMELNVIRLTEKMKAKGQTIHIDRKRGLGIFLLDESEISQKKADTALYRLTQGGSFNDMALGNKFEFDDHLVKPAKLIEYKPIVAIGELCIYKHKSQSLWYVSSHFSGNPEKYRTSDSDRARFVTHQSDLWSRYLNNQLYFEDYACEIVFRKYFGY